MLRAGLEDALGDRLRAGLLVAAFALTGVAIGLVGVSLPAIMVQFGVRDGGAGTILLLAWGGSTAGVLLCRGGVHASVLRGLVVVAAGLASLAALHTRSATVLFAVYGIGLGMTMTSISVLRVAGLEEGARRRALNQLNMLWALGACVSPVIAAHALETLRVSSLFGTLAVLFVLAAVALWAVGAGDSSGSWDESTVQKTFALPPWSVCAFAALAVGAESAVGGWLTTYAGRNAHGTALTVSAITAFWAGLLLSRTFHASRLASRDASRWLAVTGVRAHILLAAVAIAGLLAVPRGDFFLPLSLAAGWGLGPLYPFALSLVLTQYRARRIFLMAGVGSAVVPWLTGFVASHWGTLRVGVAVPLVALVVLVAIADVVRRTAAVRSDRVEAA